MVPSASFGAGPSSSTRPRDFRADGRGIKTASHYDRWMLYNWIRARKRRGETKWDTAGLSPIYGTAKTKIRCGEGVHFDYKTKMVRGVLKKTRTKIWKKNAAGKSLKNFCTLQKYNESRDWIRKRYCAVIKDPTSGKFTKADPQWLYADLKKLDKYSATSLTRSVRYAWKIK